ncbi:MAG TPA: VOC family protein [Ilumatobacter sp.]|nr:VOC family protein [Ilumatobacter sp.]
MLDHVGFQCADLAASASFYDTVLGALGFGRVMSFDEAIGYGPPDDPIFWVSVHDSGEGFRESHIAFKATDRVAVQTFFDAATSAGAEVLHEPRLWPEYHENYFGAFVRDPDGNNVEAVCHLPESAWIHRSPRPLVDVAPAHGGWSTLCPGARPVTASLRGA